MASPRPGYELDAQALLSEAEAYNERCNGGNDFAIRGASQQKRPPEALRTPTASIIPTSPSLANLTADRTSPKSAKRPRSDDFWDAEAISTGQGPPRTFKAGDASLRMGSAGHPQPSKRAKRSCTPSPDPRRVQEAVRPGNAASTVPKELFRHRAVRRQWDGQLDDGDYERLRAHRRKERVRGVDRYVPMSSLTRKPSGSFTCPGLGGSTREFGSSQVNISGNGHNGFLRIRPSALAGKAKPVGFMNLPDKVQDQILDLLMVRRDPITLDFSWLLPFVREHSNVPSTMRNINLPGLRCTIPVAPAQIEPDIKRMQAQLSSAQATLNHLATRYKPLKTPTRGLTTSLLHVCRPLNARAARIFYTRNTFAFPDPTTAWLTLESFLATIGPTNTSHLTHIRIPPPPWHLPTAHHNLEGALLDALTTATRLAVVKPLHPDRLLSALQTCTSLLLKPSTLQTLSLTLSYPDPTLHWIGRHPDTPTTFLPLTDIEAYVARKSAGIESLKQLSAMLGSQRKPILAMCNPGPVSPPEARIFRSHLAAVIREAEKYGWAVDQILREPGRTRYRAGRKR